jgi:hypothetical protein
MSGYRMIFPAFKVLEEAGEVRDCVSVGRSGRDSVAGDFTAATSKHLKVIS